MPDRDHADSESGTAATAPERSHSRIEGRSAGQAEAFYESAYNGRRFRIDATDQPFSYRLASLGDSDVTLRQNVFAGAMTGTIETVDEYVFTWITAGEGVLDLSRDPVPLAGGAPEVFPARRPNAFAFRDHRQYLVHLDADYLERVAAEENGTVPRALFFTGRRVDRTGPVDGWFSAVRTLTDVLRSDLDAPLLRHEAKLAVARATLAAFRHHAATLPAGLAAPGRAAVAHAVEFIHANAHLPLNVTMIARAVGLSTRGLQVGFQRHLASTPLAYLREVRLDRVHDELRSGTGGSVGEALRRWGFANAGRFSAQYARRFGQYPSETARR